MEFSVNSWNFWEKLRNNWKICRKTTKTSWNSFRAILPSLSASKCTNINVKEFQGGFGWKSENKCEYDREYQRVLVWFWPWFRVSVTVWLRIKCWIQVNIWLWVWKWVCSWVYARLIVYENKWVRAWIWVQFWIWMRVWVLLWGRGWARV